MISIFLTAAYVLGVLVCMYLIIQAAVWVYVGCAVVKDWLEWH